MVQEEQDLEHLQIGHSRKRYWLAYSGVFLILACFEFAFFFTCGGSVSWNMDGTRQYFVLFAYEGQWLRDVFASILAGTPTLQQWDWSMGMGADAIVATYEQLFDPFNLVSALVPAQYAEFAYQALLFVRMWVAGALFSVFARKRGNADFPCLVGSIAYAFSATLIKDLLWPGAFVGAIALPLMLYGIEKVFCGQRPYILILASLYLFAASPYFAYMIILFVAAYCIWRVFQTDRKVTLAFFFGWVAKILAPIVLGVLLASVALMPTVIGLLDTSRTTNAQVSVPVFYSLSYILGQTIGFLSFGYAGSDCCIGFGGVTIVICLLFVFNRNFRKEMRPLFVAFVATTAFLFIPAAGSMLNGFNYASNRWIFVYALLVAYIVVRMTPRLLEGAGSKRVIVISGLIIGVPLLLIAGASFALQKQGMLALSLLALASLIVGIVTIVLVMRNNAYAKAILIVGMSICTLLSGFALVRYSATPLSPWAKMYEETAQTPLSLATQIQDDTVWRCDADPDSVSVFGNSYLLNEIRGYSYYVSVYNSAADSFMTEFGIPGSNMNVSYTSLAANPILQALCSTKYYIMATEDIQELPWGFSSTPLATGTFDKAVAGSASQSTEYGIYQSQASVPFGFTCAKKISRSVLDSLELAERQDALSESVVLENTDYETSELQEITPDSTAQHADYQVIAQDGCEYSDGKIIASRKNGSITLSISALSDSDTYLQFYNLAYTASTGSSSSIGDLAKASFSAQPNDYVVSAKTDLDTDLRSFTGTRRDHWMYGGKDNWLLPLGFSEQAPTTITISFSQIGTYSFDDMDIVSQPVSGRTERLDILGSKSLQNIVLDTNSISGDISLDQEEALVLTIPYARGWSASVDGVETKLLKADVGFMALELDAGSHSVELHYSTPGLREGALTSCLGIIVLLAFVAIYEYRRKHACAILESPKDSA